MNSTHTNSQREAKYPATISEAASYDDDQRCPEIVQTAIAFPSRLSPFSVTSGCFFSALFAADKLINAQRVDHVLGQ